MYKDGKYGNRIVCSIGLKCMSILLTPNWAKALMTWIQNAEGTLRFNLTWVVIDTYLVPPHHPASSCMRTSCSSSVPRPSSVGGKEAAVPPHWHRCTHCTATPALARKFTATPGYKDAGAISYRDPSKNHDAGSGIASSCMVGVCELPNIRRREGRDEAPHDSHSIFTNPGDSPARDCYLHSPCSPDPFACFYLWLAKIKSSPQE